MKKKFFNIVKILFFLSLGLFFIFWVLGKLTPAEKQEIWESFRSVHLFWFFIAILVNIVSHMLRALRWKLLFQPMGYSPRFKFTFSAVMVGYLANLAVPRLGEVVRCGILNRYEKIPIQKSLGTVITERIIDIIVFGLFILLALVVEFHIVNDYLLKNTKGGTFAASLYVLGVIFICVVVVLGLTYIILKKRISTFPLFIKMKRIFLEFLEGILSIFKMRNPFLFIFYSLTIWFFYFLGIYITFLCLTETSSLGLKAALVTLVISSVGNMITPGGIGLYPYLFSKSLTLYNITIPVGYALGWISWLLQQVGSVFIGLFSLLGLSFVENGKKRTNQN